MSTKQREDEFDELDTIRAIPVHMIKPKGTQPRRHVDTEDAVGALQELQLSIQTEGNLVPIKVAWVEEISAFQIITGERRWRATVAAGKDTIPCIVKGEYPGYIGLSKINNAENQTGKKVTEEDLARNLFISWHILNLIALGSKHSGTLEHLELANIEKEVDDIERGVVVLDEFDQSEQKQNSVMAFLVDKLGTALELIERTPSTWRSLVTWETVQTTIKLGYLRKRGRLRLLTLLDINPEIADDVEKSDLSLAAKAELAKKSQPVQKAVVDAVKADGGLDNTTAKDIETVAAQFSADGSPAPALVPAATNINDEDDPQADDGDDRQVDHEDADGEDTEAVFEESDDENDDPESVEAELRLPTAPIPKVVADVQGDDSDDGDDLTDSHVPIKPTDDGDGDDEHMHEAIEMLQGLAILADENALSWTLEGVEFMATLVVSLGKDIDLFRIEEEHVGTVSVMLPAVTEWLATQAGNIEAQIAEGVEPAAIWMDMMGIDIDKEDD